MYLKHKIIELKDKAILELENKIVDIIDNKSEMSIYHIHVRKTAGTTVNFAFLSNHDAREPVKSFYEKLAKKSNNRIISSKKIFVGWNKELINTGKYSYAFSHIPLHDLNIPKRVFKFACLRDPVERLISHYNMLIHFKQNRIDHPCMKQEGHWIGETFNDFLRNIPQEHLLNQLFMFSKEFNVSEAFDRLMTLNQILFTESIESDLRKLSQNTGWDLPISEQKKYGSKKSITSEQHEQAKEMLELEYTLISKIEKEI